MLAYLIVRHWKAEPMPQSMNEQPEDVTEQQRKFWNSVAADKWVENQVGMNRLLTPLTDILFGAAAIQKGESVFDIGCGVGHTSQRAAEQTGEHGRVLGIDISAPMLNAARAQFDSHHLEFSEVDAANHSFVPIQWPLLKTYAAP